MLDSIEIKNFRSCEDVRLRLDEPVVALLGKNGVGKTNVLHAVQLAADLGIGDPESIFSLQARDTSKSTTFVLRFSMGSSRFVYSISRSGASSSETVFEESLEKDDASIFQRTGEIVVARTTGLPTGVRIGTGAATLSTLLQILPETHRVTVELRPVADYLRSVRYYPLRQGFQEHVGGDSPFIEMAKYGAWKAGLNDGRAHGSVQMRLLHLWLADRQRFDELKTLLGENGLGLLADIQIEEVRLPSRHSGTNGQNAIDPVYAISFMPGEDLAGAGRWFQYSGLSAGTWRILQLLTYLIFDKNSCMLLEQPEDSIHPGLLAKVIDILRTYSGRTQLICTSHSPRVMNLIGPKGIRFVTAEKGCTAVSELSDQELKSAKSYLDDEGTLAEFLETL